MEQSDRLLDENVRPAGWRNPDPEGVYDLVVLGAGTAGLVTAAGAAALGAKVALVERDRMGGDCLNTGCVPSKALIRASRAFADAKASSAFGVRGTERLSLDFGEAMARMRRLRAGIGAHDSARRFRDELGVHVFLGEGRFTGRDRVEVDGARLRFRKAAVCTGARAASPDIPGLAASGYLTNETVFSITDLPPRLLVIGAGPVGCELAQAFARFGSRVTLVESGAHVLSKEDPDAAEILHRAFARDGIDLRLGARVRDVRIEGGERVATVERGGETGEARADAILVGTGRAPNVEGIGLEEAGVAFDPRKGIRVDDALRTDNPDVYAAGDVCFPLRFTHAADALARILVRNALFPGSRKSSTLIVPWCTYTDPEVAHVGMYERDARARGIRATTLTVPLAEVDRAVLDGETEGFARVHLRAGTDEILGSTLVSAHAGESIGELTLAMANGLGLSSVGRTIHPYPTQAESIRKLADARERSRLTPFVRRLLGGWIRFRGGNH